MLKRVLTGIAVVLLLIASLAACSSGTSNAGSGSSTKAKKIVLTWYYPINVGGPVAKVVQEMADEFTKKNPNIVIHPVYCGTYDQTMTKVQTAIQANKAPDMAVLNATQIYTLKDMNAIEPLDSFINKDKDGKGYINDFYPAFLQNSKANGKIWSIPFQRSTAVLYYNKDLFKQAGLDPNTPPATWDELVADAQKLTIPGKQWGVEVPTSVGPYWLYQAFALESGKNIMSADGKKVYFDRANSIKALQFITDLATKDKVTPTGVVDWVNAPTDFINGKTAMLYQTTGNLTNIRTNAKFQFGVAFLPGDKQKGSPTGGGNVYIMKGISAERQAAAWKFIRWATSPEQAAKWSIATGYVGTRQSAYKTKEMEDYVKAFPQAAVARDQLKYASAELSTHNLGKVYQTINDAIQAAVTGKQTPEQALKDAQKQAEQELEPFQSK
ncbi:MAG: ABC transporter substrate-binding protein [Sporolactobacillus sp.]